MPLLNDKGAVEQVRFDKVTRRILLLDEPENHLDGDVMNELITFLKNDKRTIIIVSHVGIFDSIADKIWRLEKCNDAI